jgi:hypothetical protein
VEASAWSAAAAWLALGIGFLNLWYSVIRVWWRGRKASPSAQLDLLTYQNQSGEWREDERVVVTNHGPATMKRVNVDAFAEDGSSLAPEGTGLWLPMPVEYLHVGQSLYLKLERPPGHSRPTRAVVGWRDRRWRKQSRSIDLSYNRVV